MKEKRWLVHSQDEQAVKQLSRELGLPRLVARLLINRGLADAGAAREFFSADIGGLRDPFLLRDMDKAVERVKRAMDGGESIMIYGDYDVDGITSVAALYGWLKAAGANVDYYIPDRVEEGYGMNMGAIDRIAGRSATLIITVDLGVTDAAEVAYAREKGIDVVITDHHECKATLPNAVAVVNPKRPDCAYPEKALAGVGVAFKLLCALSGDTDAILRDYGELVAIGTIADVMPLTGENRAIAAYGLGRMKDSQKPALRAIISEAGAQGRKITSSVVGFAIAPRLNAAGRISSAGEAVEMLLCGDEAAAREMAGDLSRLNVARQEEGERILAQATQKVESDFDFARDRVIVLCGEDWHHGVIGVASIRITDRYYLPSVLITLEGGSGKGSGRSIPGFNLFEALGSCAHLLTKYGGHEQAAGLSIEPGNIAEFTRAINDYARQRITDDMLAPVMEMECELAPGEINVDMARLIESMEPFGRDNPQPRFLLSGVELVSVQPIGAGKHMRIQLQVGGKRLWAVYFGCRREDFRYFAGDIIDLCCCLEVNTYHGEESAQIIVKDVRRSRDGIADFKGYRDTYERFRAGGELSKDELKAITPDRGDFVAVYRGLRRLQKDGVARIRFDALCGMVSRELGAPTNYCKLRICLDIFSEMDIISLIPSGEEAIVMMAESQDKKNLNESRILGELKSRRARPEGQSDGQP